MVYYNKELNSLSKQQYILYGQIDKDPNNDELKADLLEIAEQIRKKQKIVLGELKNKMDIKVEETQRRMRVKPKNFKKEIKKDYNDLMLLYREFISNAKEISKIKKDIRDRYL